MGGFKPKCDVCGKSYPMERFDLGYATCVKCSVETKKTADVAGSDRDDAIKTSQMPNGER